MALYDEIVAQVGDYGSVILVGDMLGPILAYINDHTWAQCAFVFFLFVPPLLMAQLRGEKGLESLDTIVSWLAFLLILGLALV
ncbi:MAG: hypothetical protein ACK4JZ_02545 [Hydrogenophilus thermoluteolus]|jgi:hypothetical protein|uniref:hypothetical protein n=1 Tax=Hydrogenophilus thermoluteolus TaxID=297 RepID=UPI000EBB4F72|nr:hypothetical protein [Hydrogenophilus thermoluteolus]MBW7655839.1 hypothetical protein [Hydrogenophilus thermoluteolus]GLW59757.1 hypothetical protein Hthe01_01060 [Hydrogenophilus thermoluteolus]HCO76876.1 hypothetical protein [Rhodocyclaceae bacterium]